jgi:hypothetical protein
MDNNKNIAQETGRWLRVTVLALTTLGPLINAVAERLRERTQALRKTTGQLDLTEQSSNLTQEVSRRSSKVTQALAERSSKATQLIAEHSSKASQAIAERGSKASQELVKRSGELSNQVKEQLAERDGTLWTIVGFSVGVIAASIIAYVFIRRRLEQQAEDNEQIQLSNNGHLNIPSQSTTKGESRTVNQSTSAEQVQAVPTPVESAVAVAEPAPMETERPANATLIGVVSTKLYYPVETPLDQLAGSQEGPVEVVYFASDEEAKAQGFIAA